MQTPEQIRKLLHLLPNEAEGGYFAATYESGIHLADSMLPQFPASGNGRPLCGAIYYFLDASGFSALHRVTGDMIYHFYAGDPVEMLLLYPDSSPTRTEQCVFSNDLASGGRPMKVIPGGTWLGSRLVGGGSFALMGVTMAPGFHPVDYTIGNKEELIRSYPEQHLLIESLCR